MPVLRKRAAAGPVTVRDTVLFKVTQGGHDGYTFDGTSSVPTGSDFLIAGDIRTTNNQTDYQSFFLLTAQGGKKVTPGTDVVTAPLKIRVKAERINSYPTRFALENADDPSVPTAKSQFTPSGSGSKAKTPYVTWDPDVPWTAEKVFTIELASIAQALVDRPGWNGQEILVFWEPPAGSDGFQENTNHQIYSFDGDPAKAPYLELTFETTTQAGAPTVYLADAFDNADGTALTSRPLATGASWSGVGTWVTEGGKAKQSAANTVGRYLTADAGHADVDTFVTLGTPAAGSFVSGLAVRFTDANNYCRVNVDSRDGTLKIYEFNAGTATVRASALVSGLAGGSKQLRVRTTGRLVQAYLDGALVASYGSLTVAGTRYGLADYRLADFTQTTFDEFRVQSIS